MKRLALILAPLPLLVAVAWPQNSPRPGWQAKVDLYCGLDNSSVESVYTNNTSNTEVVTTANFVNVIDTPTEDGTPFTQLQLYVYTAGGDDVSQVVLFPQSPPSNGYGSLSNYSSATTWGNTSSLCFTLGPGAHVYCRASRVLGSGSNTDPTFGHLTLSGYSLTPSASSPAPWQTLSPVTTPSSISGAGYNYVGTSTYTNASGEGELISCLSFWGGQGANASQDAVAEIRLFTETPNGSSWSYSGQAVFYPATTNGQSLIALNVSNLGLVLQPGDRLVETSYSNSASASGYLSLSGPSWSTSSATLNWQTMVSLIDNQGSTAVQSMSTSFKNPSSTSSEVITNLNFINLAQDASQAGTPFTSIYLYTEEQSGSSFTITGETAVYTAPVGDNTYASVTGINLVLGPGDRLLVVAARPASNPIYRDSGNTAAHLTFSGYTTSP